MNKGGTINCILFLFGWQGYGSVDLGAASFGRINNGFCRLVNDFMVKDNKTVTRAVPLLLIARDLERISDHATNIAEDVIYMIQARIVKHHPEELKFVHKKEDTT